jgi:putative nucleotidyltransferase with HDIG domain
MKIRVDKKIVSDLKDWFNIYVKTFEYADAESQRNIDIKREHTERVTGEIINIGKKIGLNDNELNLAEIIALFHDIGRFEQYKRYNTFSDNKSEDHAELGIKILTEYDVLGMLDKEIQKVILCSIKNHNRPSLPLEETNTCLFYTRLLRDADKLDIWRVVTDYYHRKNSQRNVTLELELPDTPGISEEVYKALMNKQIVDMIHVKNLNDIKLLQVGWIYDINFKPTFECVKNRRYMESLRDALPKTTKITDIFNLIYSLNMDR